MVDSVVAIVAVVCAVVAQLLGGSLVEQLVVVAARQRVLRSIILLNCIFLLGN